jgi:hypothetical protein
MINKSREKVAVTNTRMIVRGASNITCLARRKGCQTAVELLVGRDQQNCRWLLSFRQDHLPS